MIFKSEKWWVYKIAGGLLTVTFCTVHYQVPVAADYWLRLMLLFTAFVFLAVSGHIINDLSDFSSDKVAGKKNIVADVGKKTAVLIVVGMLCLSLVMIILLHSQLLLVLVLFQMGLNVAYSTRPIRLKERGGIAIVVTGFYERTLPYLMILVLLNDGIDYIELSRLIGIYLAWSFFWEIRNFLSGQKADSELDRKSGQKTIAVRIEDSRFNKIQWTLFLIEIGLFLIWLVHFYQWWLILIVGIFNVMFFHKRLHGTLSIPRTRLFEQVDNFYNFSLPALFALVAVITYSDSLWPLLLFLTIGFNNHFRMFLVMMIDNIDWQKWLRYFTFPFRVISLIVNWSVYYFRKWILKWPEERNWGKHYPEYLERKRKMAEKRLASKENGQ